MNELIGRYVMIGITFVGIDDAVVEHFQTHGRILNADELTGIVVQKGDGSGVFVLPPDTKAFNVAKPGIYTLRATGEELEDPDLLTNWTIKVRSENIDQYKLVGFPGPFEPRSH